MSYFPIYPRGNKDQIDIGQDFPWNMDDYSLASRRSFQNQEDCIEYCIELAKKYNKDYVGPNVDGSTHDYLD